MKTRCLFIMLLIVLFFPISVSAIEWVRTYGVGTGHWEYERAYSIQQTTDGGYIVAGMTYSDVIEEYGMWVLKLDESGNVVWQKIYGVSDGIGGDTVSIQQTADGGYILAGKLGSYVTYGHDMWVLKLDENGNVVWQKTYGVSDTDEYAMSIQQTADGGYIVAGSFGFPTSGDGTFLGYLVFGDVWVLKLDESGNVVWQNTYGGSGEYGEGATSIQQTTDGGYIVAGITVSFGAGECDMWVLKLDESGNVVWQKAYGGQNTEGAMSVRQTSDGGYIVAGATLFSFGAGVWDMLILKLDRNGNISWSKTYGGENWEYATAIQQTTDGGYIVVGGTKTFDVNGYDNAWLLKLDSSGNISWEKSYGATGDVDEGSFVRQTTDGGYIVAGGTMSFGVDAWDIWVLKINSSGEIPGCNITYPSNAIITEPSLTVTDTDVIAQPSNATIITTGASPLNTSAMISNPCELAPTCTTWSDVVAQYHAFKNGQATFRELIECYREFRENRMH